MLIDFHTHAPLSPRYGDRDDVRVIQSLMLSEAPDPRADYITVGIHPMSDDAASWYREYVNAPEDTIAHLTSRISEYRTLYPSSPLIGIGECGWDGRSTTLSMEEQTELFRLQEFVSRRVSCPMILHIVGGWHLLLRERQHSSSPMRWYVHGFRGRATLLSQLLHAGIHISASPHLDWSTVHPPIGTFFLETDESNISIDDVYRNVSGYYSMNTNRLSTAMAAYAHDLLGLT